MQRAHSDRYYLPVYTAWPDSGCVNSFPRFFRPSRASRFSCLVDTVTSLGNVALVGLYYDHVPDLPPSPGLSEFHDSLGAQGWR